MDSTLHGLFSRTRPKTVLQMMPTKADLHTIELQGEEWYKVGRQLGLTDRELKKIKKSEKKLDNRKREMFKAWLNTSPNATCERLVTALEKVNWKTSEKVRRVFEEKDYEIERTSLEAERVELSSDRNSGSMEGEESTSLKPLISSFETPLYPGKDVPAEKHTTKPPSTVKLKNRRHKSPRIEIDSAEHVEETLDPILIRLGMLHKPSRVVSDDHTQDNMIEPSSKDSDDEFLSCNSSSDSDEDVKQTLKHVSRTSSGSMVTTSDVKGRHHKMAESPSQSSGNPRRMAQDSGEKDKV